MHGTKRTVSGDELEPRRKENWETIVIFWFFLRSGGDRLIGARIRSERRAWVTIDESLSEKEDANKLTQHICGFFGSKDEGNGTRPGFVLGAAKLARRRLEQAKYQDCRVIFKVSSLRSNYKVKWTPVHRKFLVSGQSLRKQRACLSDSIDFGCAPALQVLNCFVYVGNSFQLQFRTSVRRWKNLNASDEGRQQVFLDWILKTNEIFKLLATSTPWITQKIILRPDVERR